MEWPAIRIRNVDGQTYINQTDVCNYLYFMSDMARPHDLIASEALSQIAHNLGIFNHVEGNVSYE